MRYFTADLHLTDARVRQICHRPELVDQIVADCINHDLRAGDSLYILGDLFRADAKPTGFGNGSVWDDPEYDVPSQLQAFARIRSDIHKILVLGNHDDESFIKYFNANLGFETIVPFMTTKIGEREVLLAHDPCYAVIEPERPILCGHVHGLFRVCRNALNVGIDQWRYHPVSETDVEWIIKSMIATGFSYADIG